MGQEKPVGFKTCFFEFEPSCCEPKLGKAKLGPSTKFLYQAKPPSKAKSRAVFPLEFFKSKSAPSLMSLAATSKFPQIMADRKSVV